MINDFTFDTDASPENMNNIIKNINKNEEDITAVKESVEGLGSQIGQIANDRGYITSKSITDCNLAKTNGKYIVFNGLNQPISGGSTWLIDVTKDVGSSFIIQKAVCVFGAKGSFSRVGDGLTFTPWEEIATETNTPIIKNVPTGVTKIRDLPMGIYQIYEGSNMFTDFPKTGQCQYGILTVTVIGRYKICSIILVEGSGLNTLKIDGFVDTSHQGSTIAWTGIPMLYSPIAAAGISITLQRCYILERTMYVDVAVKRTDNGIFTANTQWGVVLFSDLTITQPKNINFSCWVPNNFSTLVGSGGTGTLYTNKTVYVRPPVDCNLIHLTGSFLLE